MQKRAYTKKMNCEQYQELIAEYNTLDDRQKALLDAHLGECRACRDFMEFERQLGSRLAKYIEANRHELTLSPEACRNIIRSVKPIAAKRQRRRIMQWNPALALAAGIMAAIISASLYFIVSVTQKRINAAQCFESPPAMPETVIALNEPAETAATGTYAGGVAWNMGQPGFKTYHDEDILYEMGAPYNEERGSGGADAGPSEKDKLEEQDDPNSAGINNRIDLAV